MIKASKAHLENIENEFWTNIKLTKLQMHILLSLTD